MTCVACREKEATKDRMCEECHQATWDGLDAIEKLPSWLTPDEIELLDTPSQEVSRSPIERIGDQFYFWTIGWKNLQGPYPDYEAARQAIRDHVNGG